MDETAYRIMDTLARNLGRPLSINALRARIDDAFSSGYYKNIYDKVGVLAKEGILKTETIGKSKIVSIDLSNPGTIDKLTEMEMERKRCVAMGNNELGMLFLEIETYFSQDFRLISSISAIDSKKNIRFRRAEFLVLLKEPRNAEELRIETVNIGRLMKQFQSGHNLRMDFIAMAQKEFFGLLASSEYNPIKPMVSGQISILYPQNYWISIREFFRKGMAVKPADESSPANISETEMEYNLARFGYKELGGKLKKGRDICIESIISSVLISGDARRKEAIPILLVKNNVNYGILVFMARKYNVDAMLLGFLKALNRIKHVDGVEDAIAVLESLGAKELKADDKSIKGKMRLYNAD